MIRPIHEIMIPLVAAYVLGDFVLPRELDVENKNNKLLLMRHALIVGVISYVLVGIVQAWPVGLLIFLSHAIIDYVRSRSSEDNLKVFAWEQFAHVVVILLVSQILTSQGLYPYESLWVRTLGKWIYSVVLLITGAIVCVHVGSIVVGLGVKPFLDQLEEVRTSSRATKSEGGEEGSRGFKEGGRIIGALERALIFLFVLVNEPTAIGFLIAAKSVFRFGELKEGANRMEAEYIIIGTLYSFLFGIVVSYLTIKLLSSI